MHIPPPGKWGRMFFDDLETKHEKLKTSKGKFFLHFYVFIQKLFSLIYFPKFSK